MSEMSEMIERVARAIDPSAFDSRYCHVDGCLDCEDGRERARQQAIAVIEALRDVPNVCYDQYRCDKMWRDLNSTEVWNLWLDASLKETV